MTANTDPSGIGVGVGMGVAVGTAVGVFVGVAVGTGVGVFLGVAVGTAVAVAVGVGTGVGSSVGITVGVAGTVTALPVGSTATSVGPSSFMAPCPQPATTTRTTANTVRQARARFSLEGSERTRKGIGQCGTTWAGRFHLSGLRAGSLLSAWVIVISVWFDARDAIRKSCVVSANIPEAKVPAQDAATLPMLC